MAVEPAIDARVMSLAKSQNGVIGWVQLLNTGLSRAAIRARVQRGALLPICRGVYAVTHPSLLPLAGEAAALVSLGEQAVLSHRSAAALWGLAKADADAVDVTLIGRKCKSRPGVTIHRTSRLDPSDIRVRSNLRLTAPARTIIDLAGVAPDDELARAMGEGRAKRLLTDSELNRALARAPRNHSGAAILRGRLLEDPGSTYTRSRAEKRMRTVLKAAGLPQPLVNSRLLGFTVDFLWPEHGLIVEVDGYRTHGNRVAFERDRRRDQVHIAAGYTVIRVTWRQLVNEPMAFVARLAQALAVRAA